MLETIFLLFTLSAIIGTINIVLLTYWLHQTRPRPPKELPKPHEEPPSNRANSA